MIPNLFRISPKRRPLRAIRLERAAWWIASCFHEARALARAETVDGRPANADRIASLAADITEAHHQINLVIRERGR